MYSHQIPSAFNQADNVFRVKACQAFGEFIQLIGVNLPIIESSVVCIEILDGCFELFILSLSIVVLLLYLFTSQHDCSQILTQLSALQLLNSRQKLILFSVLFEHFHLWSHLGQEVFQTLDVCFCLIAETEILGFCPFKDGFFYNRQRSWRLRIESALFISVLNVYLVFCYQRLIAQFDQLVLLYMNRTSSGEGDPISLKMALSQVVIRKYLNYPSTRKTLTFRSI